MKSATAVEQSFTRRTLLMGAGVGAVGLLLTARMAQLAIREGTQYRMAAEDNRVALRLIPPRRGWIVDRNGKPLAYNRPDYRIELTPDETPDLAATLAAISAMVPLAPKEIARVLEQAERQPGYVPIAVVENLPWEVFAAINVRLPELAGVRPVRGYSRAYLPNGEAYGHLLGYVAKPSSEEYQRTRNRLLLLPGFRVGKDGVEKALDSTLRGAAGARREEVNARGRPIRMLETTPDTPGSTVRLTIDRELQDYVARRIGPESASVVVMDTLTGDLLAIVSLPAFDPNAFSDGISHAEWDLLTANERHPLLNKTLNAGYPPGSTFKPVPALAFLGQGIPAEASVVCTGRYRFGGHNFHCHARRGHGRVALVSGLYKSCDTYFYHFGHIAGMDAIADMATRFGFGGKFALPMPHQRAGIVPTPTWKEERYGKAWLPGETLSCAIGQGYVLSNPLQLAVMTARIASGRQIVPRLTLDGAPPAFQSLGIPEAHLALVQRGLDNVVNAAGGTARGARLRVPIRMAGKTGTAQVRRITMAERRRGVRRNESLPWRFRDHALFIAYAPTDAPRYAISVLVEHGGSGSKAAAPLASDVMTFLFDRERAIAAVEKLEKRWGATARANAAREAARAEAAAQAANPAAAAALLPSARI